MKLVFASFLGFVDLLLILTMPWAKRTLEETDTNAADSAPASKRASTGSNALAASGDKENAHPSSKNASAQDYSKMSNTNLKGLLRERSLTQGGTKAEMIARLQEADGAQESPSNKKLTTKKGGKPAKDDIPTTSDFLCHSRPP